jgi:hypothetical protein
MKRLLILVALMGATLSAKEIESKSLGIAITFPDGPGWGELQKGVGQDKRSTFLEVENESLGEALVFSVKRDLPGGQKKAFTEYFEAWEKEQTVEGLKKLSSQVLKVGDFDAFEIILSGRKDGQDEYLRCRYFKVGDCTYCIVVGSTSQSRLTDSVASSFIDSLKITPST